MINFLKIVGHWQCKCFVLLCLFTSSSLFATEFELNGEVISSLIKEDKVQCDGFAVVLRTEHFPFQHEMAVPAKLKIAGFNGSKAIIDKHAFIKPQQLVIPRANEIKSIKRQLSEGLVYLPSNAVCHGNQIVISYWAGGNCRQCEVFVEFTLEEQQLIAVKKVNYAYFKAKGMAK